MYGSVFDCGACPYLEDRRFYVFVPDEDLHEHYRSLMDVGFRRNGDMIYHTHCPDCQACTPTRVDCLAFKMKRDQRRCWKKNQSLICTISEAISDEEHYNLFERYEQSIHNNDEADLAHILSNPAQNCTQISVRDEHDRLLGVSIIDVFNDAVSSVYCYYDPQEKSRSLGTYLALQEIEFCRQQGIQWLYLGFYVADCQKLAYKARFQPIQFYQDERWEWQYDADPAMNQEKE